MGSFLCSINIKSSKLDQMKDTLKSLSYEQKNFQEKINFYISSPKKGWIRVFPSINGRSTRISDAIAEQFSEDIFFLYVHDSSMFYYVYYKENKLLDEYCSSPDYFDKAFEEKTIEEKTTGEELKGNPSSFKHLFQPECSVNFVNSVLQTDKNIPCKGTKQIEVFSQILGMPDVMYCYEYIEEYLVDNDMDAIEDLAILQHIP